MDQKYLMLTDEVCPECTSYNPKNKKYRCDIRRRIMEGDVDMLEIAGVLVDGTCYAFNERRDDGESGDHGETIELGI